MNKMLPNWQYFDTIICNMYITYNLARFTNYLAKYTMHSLSPCYGLLTALVLLIIVAQFLQKW